MKRYHISAPTEWWQLIQKTNDHGTHYYDRYRLKGVYRRLIEEHGGRLVSNEQAYPTSHVIVEFDDDEAMVQFKLEAV